MATMRSVTLMRAVLSQGELVILGKSLQQLVFVRIDSTKVRAVANWHWIGLRAGDYPSHHKSGYEEALPLHSGSTSCTR